MNELKRELKNALHILYGYEEWPELSVAPETANADFSSNIAMKLAKLLKKPPLEIAKEIKEYLEKSWQGTIEVAPPGFLNFISRDEYFAEKIAKIDANFQEFISQDEYEGKTIVTEFSDPNPFKVLHVGHLYTSIVGDSISRLLEKAGGKVIRVNFGGDVGLHVAKTSYMMLKEQEKLEELTTPSERAEWMAKCYVEGSRAYEDDETAKEEIIKLNREIYDLVLADDHSSPLANLYWTGRNWSYDYFKDFYAKIGVKFDRFYPESTVAERGLKEVKGALGKGIYEESDGAVVYKGEKLGLHTRVFINKNGLPTYEAKDVGLIFTKWDDYHFDRSIIITGNDIIEYMKVVLASISEYAPELPERTTHITHSNVKLPGGVKMASRKGNFLRAVDVLKMIEEALKEEYGTVDKTVALGAIKYAFLRYKIGGGDIALDVKTAVSTTGNSGPYLQYSAVRAKKILKKATKIANPPKTTDQESFSSSNSDLSGETPTSNSNLDKAPNSHLYEPFERSLAKKLSLYPEALSVAISEYAPHKLCAYLYELAQEFSRFYENCPVAGSDRELLRRELVAAYLKVLTDGLDLLGIKIPEEM